jgi:two-component system, OmpR family, response regulator
MRVLVVEDNQLVSELVEAGLASNGWQADVAALGADAVKLFQKHEYDVVILDIELPDADGFTLLAKFRAHRRDIPILMLTARSGPDAAVKGLGAGADDYISKPFDTSELVARILAVVRRNNTQETLRFGDLTFYRLTRETTCGGKRLRLTPKEQIFLEKLMLTPHQVISRDDLLRSVWRITFDPGSNLMDAHVARLRAKLKAAGCNVQIVTARNEGFSLAHNEPASTGRES